MTFRRDKLPPEHFGPDYWDHYAGERGPLDPDSILSPEEIFGDLAEAGLELRGLRVIDLGCGPGHYVKMFRERGAEACGIDFSAHALALAEPAVQPFLRRQNIEELHAYPDRAFDLAIHNAAVYLPLEELGAHFREVARILEGHLYLHLIVSDHPFWWSLDRPRYAPFPGKPTHWWLQTVEGAGFKRTHLFSHSGWSWWAMFRRE